MIVPGKTVLCDTGVISRYATGATDILQTIDEEIGIDNVIITPVVRIELCNWLSGYQSLTKSYRSSLLKFIRGLELAHINEEISRLAVSLNDKHINSKPADTLIAATALHHSLPVYTLNRKDYLQLGATLYV